MSFRGAEGPLSVRKDVAKMKTGDGDQRQKLARQRTTDADKERVERKRREENICGRLMNESRIEDGDGPKTMGKGKEGWVNLVKFDRQPL